MCAIPEDLFDIQLDIYRRYHQTVEEFYKQEDLWEFPGQWNAAINRRK